MASAREYWFIKTAFRLTQLEMVEAQGQVSKRQSAKEEAKHIKLFSKLNQDSEIWSQS